MDLLGFQPEATHACHERFGTIDLPTAYENGWPSPYGMAGWKPTCVPETCGMQAKRHPRLDEKPATLRVSVSDFHFTLEHSWNAPTI